MNTFRKIGDGWGVFCPGLQQPGDVITVTKRNGDTSTATLAEFKGNGVWTLAAREKPAAVTVGDMTGVCGLFDNATRSKLRRPAIVLHIVGLGEVKLSMAGPSARVPGSINVATDGGATWFGRITRDGAFEPSGRQSVPAGLVDALVAFAREPARMAAEHGRRTGLCCFCNLRLNDARSTAVGYGATCAKRWGQPWGVKAARVFMAEAA